MDKLSMRQYVALLETRIEETLKKWHRASRIEDGPVVQIEYQFEQAHIGLDIFWHDTEERVNIECRDPRMTRKDQLKGLTPETITLIMDRVGNFAQIVQSRTYRQNK